MIKNILILILVFINISLHAQNKPFPQNIKYAYGFKPNSITNATIITNYKNWKNKYRCVQAISATLDFSKYTSLADL